jgi:hypothetical protein
MRVIAIDPGVMTGYVYADVEDGKAQCFPFQMTDDVDDLYRRLVDFKPRYIVMEDFEFRSRASTGLNLFPVQLIGVARLYEIMSLDQVAVYLQKPSYGKSYYTDPTLKAKKLYKRGVPHGMDALRHLLQWLTFGAGNRFIAKDDDFAVLLDKWNT